MATAEPPPASSPPLLNDEENILKDKNNENEVFSPQVQPEEEEPVLKYMNIPDGILSDPDYEPMPISLVAYSVDNEYVDKIPADVEWEGDAWVAVCNGTGKKAGKSHKKAGRMCGEDAPNLEDSDKHYRTTDAVARYDPIVVKEGHRMFSSWDKIGCTDIAQHRVDLGRIRPGQALFSEKQGEWCYLIDWFHRTEELKPYFLCYVPQSRLFKMNDNERFNSVGQKRTNKLRNKWTLKDLRNLKRGNVVVVDGSNCRIGLNYPREWGFFAQPCSNTGVVNASYGPFDWLFYWYEDLDTYTDESAGLLLAERQRLREEKRLLDQANKRAKTEQQQRQIHSKAMSEVTRMRGTSANIDQYSPRTSLLSGRARSNPTIRRWKMNGSKSVTEASESGAPSPRHSLAPDDEKVIETPEPVSQDDTPLVVPPRNLSSDRSKMAGYVAVLPRPSPRKSDSLPQKKDDSRPDSYLSHNLRAELKEHKGSMDLVVQIVKEIESKIQRRNEDMETMLKDFMTELYAYCGNTLPTVVKDALTDLLRDNRFESEISPSLISKIREIVLDQIALKPKDPSREETPSRRSLPLTPKRAEQREESDDSDESDEEDEEDSSDDTSSQGDGRPSSGDESDEPSASETNVGKKPGSNSLSGTGDDDSTQDSPPRPPTPEPPPTNASKGLKRKSSGSKESSESAPKPPKKRARVMEEGSDTESVWSFLSRADGRFQHPQSDEFDPDERFYSSETFQLYIAKFEEISGLKVTDEKQRLAVARLCGHNKYKLDKFRGSADELIKKFDKAVRHNSADKTINQLYDSPRILPTKGTKGAHSVLPTKGPLSSNAAFRASLGGKAPKYPIVQPSQQEKVKLPPKRGRGKSAIVGEFPNDAPAGINTKLKVEGELSSPSKYKHSKCLKWLPVGVEKEIIEHANQKVPPLTFVKHVALKLSRILVNDRKCPYITGPQSFKNMCLRAGKKLKNKVGFSIQKDIIKTLPPIFVIIDRALEYRTLVAPVRAKGILSCIQYMGKLEYNRVYRGEQKIADEGKETKAMKAAAIKDIKKLSQAPVKQSEAPRKLSEAPRRRIEAPKRRSVAKKGKLSGPSSSDLSPLALASKSPSPSPEPEVQVEKEPKKKQKHKR